MEPLASYELKHPILLPCFYKPIFQYAAFYITLFYCLYCRENNMIIYMRQHMYVTVSNNDITSVITETHDLTICTKN